MTTQDGCARCDMPPGHNSTLCEPCSELANRIIARWLDGGDLPQEELGARLGLSTTALEKRIERARTGAGIRKRVPRTCKCGSPCRQHFHVCPSCSAKADEAIASGAKYGAVAALGITAGGYRMRKRRAAGEAA